MPKKAKSYIEVELDWLEDVVREARAYIDSYRPFTEKITDRTEVHPNAKGDPIIKLMANKEQTLKALMDVLKELPSMLKGLDELREKRAAASLETRGDIKIPGAMKRFVEEKTG